MSLGFNNKYLRFFYQVILITITFPVRYLSFFIPLDKKIWIFGNTYGYKDNPKYVYEHILRGQDSSIRPIWISKVKLNSTTDILGENYYYLSLKGIYFQYRASVVLLATGKNDVASFALNNKIIVQLWHGIPIKKLLLDSVETSPFPSNLKIINRIFYRILRHNLNKYNIVCAVNNHNQQCLAKAFGLPLDRVKVTGMPRHDVILSSDFKNKKNIKRILYAPTWHSSLEEAREFLSQVLSSDFKQYCRRNSIQLDVSIHPLNDTLIKNIPLFAGSTPISHNDINEQLSRYDLLITDYSSIAFDFAILGRPVIFSCANIVRYSTQRGIYADFINLLKDQNVTGRFLIRKVDGYLNGKIKASPIYDYPHIGNACNRVIKEVKKLT